MADKFDPYHKWLGIPPRDQPANHYRLLSIDLFESDRTVIDGAARRLAVYVKSCAVGPHQADAKRILAEIVAARAILVDPQRRAAYDQQLASPPPAAPSAPTIPASRSSTAPGGVAAGAAPPGDLAVPSEQLPPLPPESQWSAPLPDASLTAPPLPPEATDTVTNLQAGIVTVPDFGRSARSKKSGAYKTVKAAKHPAVDTAAAPGKASSRRKSKKRPVWMFVLGGVGVVAVLGIVAAVFRSPAGDDGAPATKVADKGSPQQSREASATSTGDESGKADKPDNVEMATATDYEDDDKSESTPAAAVARAGSGPSSKLIEAIDTDAPLAAVQQLIAAGADIGTEDKSGRTPLRLAVIKGRADLVKALLAKKADPNVADLRGETPLMSAARLGNETILKLLLEAGADPNDKTAVRAAPGKSADRE